MKKLVISALLAIPVLGIAQSRISTFKIEDVYIESGIFKDAQTIDLKYMMSLDPDRLLAPFLREAGLSPKAQSYPNWENTGLDGHTGGHYLSALAMMWASTKDDLVHERLNYMLSELKRCQDANGDGYIGGVPGSKALWLDVSTGKINAGGFDLNKKWVPLYNIHKTYAGLRDAYIHANSNLSKVMLIKFTDWMANITADLTSVQIQDMLRSEHGGLNEIFADVAAITGDQNYLDLARRFSHNEILDPLKNRQDKLNNLHANTQIPKVIGFERIAAVSGTESGYHDAARFFWENVVTKRSAVIGGNSVREHFHPADDFSSMISSEQGPETCNTYNMLRLTKALFESEGGEHYIDYYERALYNHILSTQHPAKGGFVYFTPMRPGHYRVYSQPQTSFWCCVGSGLENHAKYSELIYAHTDDALLVNLFIPSTLTWRDKGLVLTQKTQFPDEETTELTIRSVRRPHFSIDIRYPDWVAPTALAVKVNGHAVPIEAAPGSYARISRKWKAGDKLTITLPMKTSVENLPDGSDYLAVLHGPIVLAAKAGTEHLDGLFADEGRMSHIAGGKKIAMQALPLFVSKNKDVASGLKPVPGKPLTFTAENLIQPANFRSLELIPFFRLHDSRYIIYWQSLTPERLEEMRRKVLMEDALRQKLDDLTLDVVTPGEQQPESDHFIESSNSRTGVKENRHWRSASDGWFSYKMRDHELQAKSIRITYNNDDRDKSARITVNGVFLEEGVIENREQGFYDVDYTIPVEVSKRSNGQLIIKIESAQGAATPRVFEVRLLKER